MSIRIFNKLNSIIMNSINSIVELSTTVFGDNFKFSFAKNSYGYNYGVSASTGMSSFSSDMWTTIVTTSEELFILVCSSVRLGVSEFMSVVMSVVRGTHATGSVKNRISNNNIKNNNKSSSFDLLRIYV